MHMLITGNSGFLGTHLVRALKSRSHRIIPFSRQSRKDILLQQNFTDIPAVDFVLHLASSTKDNIYKTNILGTINVLKFAKNRHIPIVFASSYTPNFPHNAYQLSKRIGELLCLWYSFRHKLSITVLRYTNLYGPGQRPPFIIPKMMNELRQKNTITIQSGLSRDFLHVQDAVSAILAVVKMFPHKFTVMTIGSGVSTQLSDVATQLTRLSHRKNTRIISQTPDPHLPKKTLAQINRAADVFGWRPKITLAEGLKQTYEHRHHHA